jgi:hypothetical protein
MGRQLAIAHGPKESLDFYITRLSLITTGNSSRSIVLLAGLSAFESFGWLQKSGVVFHHQSAVVAGSM